VNVPAELSHWYQQNLGNSNDWYEMYHETFTIHTVPRWCILQSALRVKHRKTAFSRFAAARSVHDGHAFYADIAQSWATSNDEFAKFKKLYNSVDWSQEVRKKRLKQENNAKHRAIKIADLNNNKQKPQVDQLQ
jgi:hypothetical protein